MKSTSDAIRQRPPTTKDGEVLETTTAGAGPAAAKVRIALMRMTKSRACGFAVLISTRFQLFYKPIVATTVASLTKWLSQRLKTVVLVEAFGFNHTAQSFQVAA